MKFVRQHSTISHVQRAAGIQMDEQDAVFEKHNKKTMYLIKISIVATVVGTLISVFFVMPKNYIYYDFFLIIGELFKNIMIVSILIEIIYYFVHKTELSPIYKKINEDRRRCIHSQKDTYEVKPSDPFDPSYGVNNPASPFCHHPNSFSERFRHRE